MAGSVHNEQSNNSPGCFAQQDQFREPSTDTSKRKETLITVSTTKMNQELELLHNQTKTNKRGRLNVKIFAWACFGLLGMMLPHAKADEWNQKTVLTFSEPVELPGQVLSPGAYTFKLADSDSDRNIVQVFNKDETHLYGTFLTTPDYRLQPASKTIINFDERAAGSPEAVRAWFYPGDNYGQEFVYPKAKAVELAKANKQPVASMPTELAADTTKPAETMKEPAVVAMKQAPLKAQQPTGEEAEIAEVFAVTEAAAELPKKLPETASPLPLVGLIGVLSLAAAGLLRFTGAKWNERGNS